MKPLGVARVIIEKLEGAVMALGTYRGASDNDQDSRAVLYARIERLADELKAAVDDDMRSMPSTPRGSK